MTDPRPSFPEYYLTIAQAVARRGDCTRSQVGAVLVSTSHVAVFGYNGTEEHGQPGCLAGACPRGRMSFDDCPPYTAYDNCIAVHAEANALKKAYYRVDLRGGSAYVTREPCDDCYKLLDDAGLKDVWWVTDGEPGHRDLDELPAGECTRSATPV